MKKTFTKLTFALALAGAAVTFSVQPAKAACGGGILCPDVWDPVICSDGVVYSNACYARAACAHDCVPYGDTV
ncbi:MAG TPA: Kazal-type serine protease inhibitor [Thermoanaerobaculia bacterium]|jgi:hypothetical protein|nr:Kazal-type serine protease inhibitor [Thermoanaerobaculia bacterium]